MRKVSEKNEIVEDVRNIRERLLVEAKGDPMIINNHGKALAKKYGLKLSKKIPLVLKGPKHVA
jgi:hypothetical protein